MLIDQQDSNVLALGGETVEGGFNVLVLGFGVDNEEVLLGVRGLGDVLGSWSVNGMSARLTGKVEEE